MEALTNELGDKASGYERNKLIPDIPFVDYAKAEGMNSSGIKEMLRSAAHFYEFKVNRAEEKVSKALQLGRLVHLGVLEPKLFKQRCVVEPVFEGLTKDGRMSTQSAAARQKKNEWYLGLDKEAIVIPQDQLDQLTGMVAKLLKHPRAMKLLEDGLRESTMFWNDTETGELCKMRPDFVTSKGHMVDLKTTRDARESYFSKDIYNLRYHVQAAHYCAGARATGVCNPDYFIFLAIESEPPYEIAIYPAGTSVLGVGDQWRSNAMKLYTKCKRENKWPGYNPDARVIELPTWAEAVDPDEEE